MYGEEENSSRMRHTWPRLTFDLLSLSLFLLQALQRINSQLSNEERTKGAHVVISADGTPDEVKARVHEEWQKFLERKHVHPKP